MGVRVRVSADPKVTFTEDSPLTATEIAKALPHIAMQNANQVRGSVGMGDAFKIPLDETLKQGAINRASHKETVVNFAKAISKGLKLDLYYSVSELAEFFQERWERLAMKTGASEGDEAQVKKTADDVMTMLSKLVASHGKSAPDAEPA